MGGKKESSEEGLRTVTGGWVGEEPEKDSAEYEDDGDEVDGVLGEPGPQRLLLADV